MTDYKVSRNEKGFIVYSKVCEFCNSKYKARKINTKYCSNSCRNLKMIKGRAKKDE